MKVVRGIDRTPRGWEVRTDEGMHYHGHHVMKIQHIRRFYSKFLIVAYLKAKFSRSKNYDDGPQV